MFGASLARIYCIYLRTKLFGVSWQQLDYRNVNIDIPNWYRSVHSWYATLKHVMIHMRDYVCLLLWNSGFNLNKFRACASKSDRLSSVQFLSQYKHFNFVFLTTQASHLHSVDVHQFSLSGYGFPFSHLRKHMSLATRSTLRSGQPRDLKNGHVVGALMHAARAT